MSEHTANLIWSRDGRDFSYEAYSRDHVWRFDDGVEIAASAAPDYFGGAGRLDPEEALVAALASCHMLTFLAIAAKSGLVVDRYEDRPVGVLEKNEAGRLAITRISLHPRIVFGGEKSPDAAALERLHAKAHANCFISQSIRAAVTIAH